MQDFEKLGTFYLGKECDLDTLTTGDNLLLYDAKDLTTHAMIVGMTGSGKTGLAIALLEEAAIDGIPSILIDPKGDLGNILLRFPELRADDFRPWLDEAEMARSGVSPDLLAGQIAEDWKKGLAQWGQDSARIRRLTDAAEVAVYTPGNTSVRPLQILRSFAAPPPALAQDDTALRDRILSAVSGLLGLLGMEADPVQSREHILLSTILHHAWRGGRSLDLAGIIQEVQKPPFDKVGVFDLESFYPAKERLSLAMSLNNVIASPGFHAWLEGEPIDVQRMLFTAEGKPRTSVIYLAHLSDAERMFFVTILLNEVIAWMRSQSGTGSLRALLYMDEIFGYFPPNANPPSKMPMLTLLKQARAYGLGIVLSSQNPVDLDYKGLSNCGTWFIGRLQTERDKLRIIEGLEGASAGSGAGFDRAQTERMLSGLGKRVFLMRNVHEEMPAVFQTRWTMSYLRGPLTLPQLARFSSHDAPATLSPAASAHEVRATKTTPDAPLPVLPPDVPVFFLRPKYSAAGNIVYKPRVIGISKLHFVDAKTELDTWLNRTHLAPFSEDGRSVAWDEAEQHSGPATTLDRRPLPESSFAELPASASNPKSYVTWARSLEDSLYQNCTLDLLTCPALRLTAQPEESEVDFRVRAMQLLREQRDAEVAKLKAKYAPKLQSLADQLRRATERMEREKAQSGQQKINTALAIGATLLGAFLGRGIARVGNVGRATSAMKSASRIGKESADVSRATESVDVVRERLTALQAQFDEEVATLQQGGASGALDTQKRSVHPRKSDISVGMVGLCWTPWKRLPDGTLEPT